MRVISNKKIIEFSNAYPNAYKPLQSWRKIMEFHSFENFAQLKAIFGSVDKVDDLIVFDICGNQYRLITFITFKKQICYIKQILTHTKYDKGRWKK
jgi:mRNA interferase HigB